MCLPFVARGQKPAYLFTALSKTLSQRRLLHNIEKYLLYERLQNTKQVTQLVVFLRTIPSKTNTVSLVIKKMIHFPINY